ncbi:methionyl-tRNA formyltransferase [Acetobacterium bakii]|uniref:methionyl-tRNA formyltransferase n=1 Tax=Acetobacterium bakii TaxID=52689 RepID=UPI0006812D53|nr:methionyl-tRNA formyltransferase [Acetobacterium bakii]
MKIVLVGQALFGKDCLEALINQGEEIVGVITIPDDPRGRPNPVKDLAMDKEIPVLQPPGQCPHRLKDPAVIAMVKDLKPDLFVFAFVSDIMPYNIIKMAAFGAINYHPSLLPKYRGGSAINWAIIQGERETGVTIHYINERVDAGDIILQGKVDIEATDSVGSVYFNKLYPLGIKLMPQAVKLIREGKAPRIPQDETQATYQPLITEADVKINWKNTAETVCNMIRGANPSPGAYAQFRGAKVKIWECEISKAVFGKIPGEVAEVAEGKGFKIAADRGAVLIKKVQLKGEAKITASQFIEHSHLKPGEQWT